MAQLEDARRSARPLTWAHRTHCAAIAAWARCDFIARELPCNCRRTSYAATLPIYVRACWSSRCDS
eukprot:11348453-Alexandrium_andersonii.AAC.1